MKYCPENEWIKRAYLAFAKDAKQLCTSSVDGIANSIAQFERFTNHRNFKSFHSQHASDFKDFLASNVSGPHGKPISLATQHTILSQLKKFFEWISHEPGYRILRYNDAEYFQLSRKDTTISKSYRTRAFPSQTQIIETVLAMPVATDMDLRDRALMAFVFLTGSRDGAVSSMKLKHVELESNRIYQDAKDVKTKFSKSFPTYFFPVSAKLLQIFTEYIGYLRNNLGRDEASPLFPATKVLWIDGGFQAVGLSELHWSSASPIREIFKVNFELVGLPYFPPHSFRHTLVQMAERMCSSPEQFKAWSQNLGHENVLTTFTSYGNVGEVRQGEIIMDLAKPQVLQGDPMLDRLKQLVTDFESGRSFRLPAV